VAETLYLLPREELKALTTIRQHTHNPNITPSVKPPATVQTKNHRRKCAIDGFSVVNVESTTPYTPAMIVGIVHDKSNISDNFRLWQSLLAASIAKRNTPKATNPSTGVTLKPAKKLAINTVTWATAAIENCNCVRAIIFFSGLCAIT
jgi:hypothetical protein